MANPFQQARIRQIQTEQQQKYQRVVVDTKPNHT